jgi:ribosomal protein S18 acetylase RimI-like enzyme
MIGGKKTQVKEKVLSSEFCQNYRLRSGSGKDRALLVKFMCLTYQELFPNQKDFSHLAKTVEQYLSPETPIWWVESADNPSPSPSLILPIGGLWMGNAIDQVTGERYAHIFLLYVIPEYRRRGIATALIHQAQSWAISRGDRQIGLQVFNSNQPALHLYHRLGFQTHSLLMLKSLQ